MDVIVANRPDGLFGICDHVPRQIAELIPLVPRCGFHDVWLYLRAVNGEEGERERLLSCAESRTDRTQRMERGNVPTIQPPTFDSVRRGPDDLPRQVPELIILIPRHRPHGALHALRRGPDDGFGNVPERVFLVPGHRPNDALEWFERTPHPLARGNVVRAMIVANYIVPTARGKRDAK